MKCELLFSVLNFLSELNYEKNEDTCVYSRQDHGGSGKR